MWSRQCEWSASYLAGKWLSRGHQSVKRTVTDVSRSGKTPRVPGSTSKLPPSRRGPLCTNRDYAGPVTRVCISSDDHCSSQPRRLLPGHRSAGNSCKGQVDVIRRLEVGEPVLHHQTRARLTQLGPRPGPLCEPEGSADVGCARIGVRNNRSPSEAPCCRRLAHDRAAVNVVHTSVADHEARKMKMNRLL